MHLNEIGKKLIKINSSLLLLVFENQFKKKTRTRTRYTHKVYKGNNNQLN